MMNIVFYGERGLVNSIIADMGEDLKKHKAFLTAIKLTDGRKLGWAHEISEIPQYIIEPSFAEFGDPDLIIVAKAKDKRYVIFIEAKLCAYNDASAELSKNNNLLLENYDGKASKVNVQLAFKYRFVQAYKNLNKNNGVVEDEQTAKQYNDKPRRLKKPKVVNMCENSFENVENYYFVALTNDNADIDPYQNKSFLPPIGENWGEASCNFGVLSYDMLEKARVVNKDNGYYKEPRVSMLGEPADIGANPANCKKIYTKNMNNWTQEQRDTLEQFKNEIKKKVDVEIKQYEGSYSIKVQDITVVKFFASSHKDEKDDVYLVFRNDSLPKEYVNEDKVLIGTADNAKSFAVIYKGPPKGPSKEFLDFVDETVKFIDR